MAVVTFKKAEPKQARLRISLYGPPGSGKTFTALLVAEGLAKVDGKKIAYVDTESGTDFYGKAAPRKVHPDAFDFDAIYTQSLLDVSDSIGALDPKVYGVVVLDSISHIWDAAIAAFEGAKTKAGTIQMKDWGTIKKPYKDLIRWLMDSPFHVFILGRQKNLFEDGDDGMRKVGVAMRAEGETAYEPQVCVRMTGDPKNETVYAFFEKDRSGINEGKTVPNPSFATFEPMLALLGTEQRVTEDPDAVAMKDSELHRRDDGKGAEKEAKSSEAFAAFNGRLVSADSVATLGAVAVEIKKSRTLLDTHRDALRVVYEERRAALVNKIAPEGV